MSWQLPHELRAQPHLPTIAEASTPHPASIACSKLHTTSCLQLFFSASCKLVHIARIPRELYQPYLLVSTPAEMFFKQLPHPANAPTAYLRQATQALAMMLGHASWHFTSSSQVLESCAAN
jgi:hypothetical protein